MEIINLDCVDSTNNYLKCRLQEFPDRDVAVFADEQTSGRGNGLNTWHSGKGQNLTFSILVHPRIVRAADSFLVSQTMALALSDVVAKWLKTAERVRIKWPNDIYIVPERLKLSGTLIETTMAAGFIQTAVIGVGLNVNETDFPPSLPNPVSMAQIIGHSLPLPQLRDDIINAFHGYYSMLMSGQNDRIRALYHTRLYLLGIESEFDDGGGVFRATVEGTTTEGRLRLTDSLGRPREYGFKEITFKT